MQFDQHTLDLLAEIALFKGQDLKEILSEAETLGISNYHAENTNLSKFGLFRCDNDGCIYHEDDLIITYEDESIHISSAIYCDTSARWFNGNNYEIESFGPYGRRFCSYYCDEIMSDGEANIGGYTVTYIDGEYFDRSYLYYWESDGEYHKEAEPEYNFSYHGSNPAFKCTIEGAKIGFEIEKEDLDAKQSVYAHELQSETGWGKENDGSLCATTGFELVSPVFSLHESKDYFRNEFGRLKELINADYSSNCGGHINYSHPDYSSANLLENIKGYLPLLYSIYEHRINSRWSKAKSTKDLIRDGEKYQSVNLKRHCIEFRIFPAVKNIENLLWRLELIQIIDLHKTKSPLQVINWIADFNHPLHLHLSKVFSYEKLLQKVLLIAKYSQSLENVTISERALSETENALTLPDLLKK